MLTSYFFFKLKFSASFSHFALSSSGAISFMFKGTVSPPERCDFTFSQQYNNNVL